MMTETVSSLLFYLFGATAVIFAAAAVTTERILRAALYLMVVLLGTAALYACLGADFLAALQVLVYVGGIVVLLVFAVMLTHTNELVEERPTALRKLCGFAGAALFVGTTYYVLSLQQLRPVSHGPVASADAAALGRSFLNYGAGGYALPFELISVLLLAAIIGGIVVARKSILQTEAGK